MTKVSLIAEVQESFVEFVAKCHLNQIRNADRPTTTARLMHEIRTISADYGAKKEVDDNTAKECVRLIFEKFGHLSIEEMRKAYRMWASEEIKIEGAEIYAGMLNVRQIGKVLAAYNDVRKKVLGNYLSITANEKNRLEAETKANEMRERFEAEFPLVVAKAKANIKDWRDVPEYFYESIKSRWGFNFEPGEANAIFEDAKELANLEINKDRADSFAGGLAARIKQMANEANFEEKAKVIARKLTVFRKVIQNPQFQIS